MNILNKQSRSHHKCCIALGNFDGVHNGHRHIISECVEYAKRVGTPSMIYTFSAHPSFFLGTGVRLLTSIDERIEIFRNLGCDSVYLEDFTDVSELSPQEFCEDILVNKLSATAVFCGENYSFGKNAKGNAQMLESILREHNVEVFVSKHVTEDGETVSSTCIRKHIEEGNVKKASTLLGCPYFIYGKVIHGKKIGRTIGFPTINIDIPEYKVTPRLGVYFTVTQIDGKLFYSISNIGKRPTLDIGTENESYINCETHIIGHDGDDYGKEATVYFIDHIRDEMKFDGIDELQSAISSDLKTAERMSKGFNKDSILTF